LSTAHPAHDHDRMPPGQAVEVADGVFAYVQPDGSWFINNTGFLVGANGAVAVDSCSTERRTRAFADTVAGLSPGPVHTLLNTHSHPDHTAGNGWFPGATVVAHERCRAELVGAPRPALDGIFEPFRSTFEKGTGLGLPIVHRIVTDYSGVIQVSSTLGVGTAVHVRLPHRAATSAEAVTAGAGVHILGAEPFSRSAAR